METKRIDWNRIFTILYYIAFVLLIIFQFEKTTMFHIVWPDYFGDYIYFFVVLAAALRVVMQERKREDELDEGAIEKAIEKRGWKILVLGFIGFVLVFSWHTREQMALLPITALILGADGLDRETLFKIFVITEAALFAVTLAAGLMEWIPDLVYSQKIHDFKERHSFGFVYPTDCCAHWLFLVLSYTWIRDKKMTIIEMLLVPISAVLCLRFCDARTTAILLILLVFGASILRAGSWFMKKESKVLHGLSGIAAIGTAAILPIASVMVHAFYDPTNPVMYKLDRVVSHRFSLGKLGIDMYGIKVWGQTVIQQGAGGSLVPPSKYFFIDNSYLLILLRFGVAASLVLYGIILVITIHEWKQRNYLQLWILVLILLSCFMEHHLFDISYNPIFLLFISAFDGLFFGKKDSKEIEARVIEDNSKADEVNYAGRKKTL